MANKCPRCNTVNSINAKFCSVCGSPLKGAGQAPPRRAPQNPRRAPARSPQNNTYTTGPLPPYSGRGNQGYASPGNVRVNPVAVGPRPLAMETWAKFFFYTYIISLVLFIFSIGFIFFSLLLFSSDYSTGVAGGAFGTIFAGICFCIAALSYYFLENLSLNILGVKRRVEGAWLVWIPYAHCYPIGQLIDDELWGTKNASKLLCFGVVLIPILYFTSIFISLFTFATSVSSLGVLSIDPTGSSIVPALTTVFFSSYLSIFLSILYFIYIVVYAIYRISANYKLITMYGVNVALAVFSIFFFFLYPIAFYRASVNAAWK